MPPSEDPLADAMVADLRSLEQEEQAKLIRLGLEGSEGGALLAAPESVRKFFDSYAEPPDWVDLNSFFPGCRMFHRNTPLVLAGMVGGVLVEGFSTNIAKSFFMTGRLRDQGMRRLKQNNRHMLEIFMPGGMDKHSDGWSLSIRVRLVHARIRLLLSNSDEWDLEELGTPISAAHLGFAISAFSARLLSHLKSLGASFSEEERRSFMAVWRYSGYLMGIPETILFRDEQHALKVFEDRPTVRTTSLFGVDGSRVVAGQHRALVRGDDGKSSASEDGGLHSSGLASADRERARRRTQLPQELYLWNPVEIPAAESY